MKPQLMGVVIAFVGLATLAQSADKPVPLIHYTKHGGMLSNIKIAEVRVEATGQVTVRYEKQAQRPSDYRFSLDEDELAALTSLVRVVRFFEQPASDTARVTDVGESSLTVNIGNDRRTLHYRFRQELDPLTRELWRMIQQGIVTSELETKGDVYQAMVASSPLLIGSKVYCPRLLVPSLKKNVAQCQDRQKLGWGLTALAWLQTEEQWLGFVSSQLANAAPERKALLLGVLGSHPFYDSIPDGHCRILLPLLTSVLDSFSEKKDRIDPATDEALGNVCQMIAAKKYDRSLPVLLKLRDAHGVSVADGEADFAIERINAEKEKAQP